MITCPRCGGLAPDGSPWCPHCGYGRPQAPIVYQPPQPIPARYEEANTPPDPKLTKPAKKKSGCLKNILLFFGLVFIGVVIIVIALIIIDPSSDKKVPTPTATMTVVLTATPTRTPAPTRTPYPTATERPESCNIKGNRNKLIYHCKNSPNYDMTTDSIRWFCSPEEAEAAGYRPAETMGGRCEQ